MLHVRCVLIVLCNTSQFTVTFYISHRLHTAQQQGLNTWTGTRVREVFLPFRQSNSSTESDVQSL